MSELSVKDIFEEMKTTDLHENVTEAELWLQKNSLKSPSIREDIKQTIDNTIERINVFCKLDTKMQLLDKLADEVKKHSTLLYQLELKERHILVKDSKNKTVPMFIDYLKYYAQWSCMIYDECPDYKPYGLCRIVLDADTPLPIIGEILGAALAAGNALLCQIEPKMRPLAWFLLELFENAGFPKDTITFIECSDNKNICYDSRIKKLTVVGNLRSYSNTLPLYNDFDYCSYSLLHLGKTSAIIFENADQNSACYKLLDCAWSCKGMFPFGINELLVQESIFEEFVDKIKLKILKLNVAYREDCIQNKTTDLLISANSNYKQQEIEIINKIPLQIGHKTFGKNFSENETSDVLSILAFRTAAEAVNLVNNNKFGLGVSIWSDNVSLCNELTGKIKAGILWINTHGIISPNAAFCPAKHSGLGYFGGKEGLLEYMRPKEKYEFYKNVPNLETIVNKKTIQTCIESAKKGYEIWCKYFPTARNQCLLKLAELSVPLKSKFPTNNYDEFWIKPLRYWSVICNNSKSIIQLQGNVELKIYKEPAGVTLHDISIIQDFETIIAALAFGNAVIITNSCPELDSFFEGLIDIIPKAGIPAGLVNVIFKSNRKIISNLLLHNNIERSHCLPVRIQEADFVVKNYGKAVLREDILKAVSYNKCIWTTFGETLL